MNTGVCGTESDGWSVWPCKAGTGPVGQALWFSGACCHPRMGVVETATSLKSRHGLLKQLDHNGINWCKFFAFSASH